MTHCRRHIKLPIDSHFSPKSPTFEQTPNIPSCYGQSSPSPLGSLPVGEGRNDSCTNIRCQEEGMANVACATEGVTSESVSLGTLEEDVRVVIVTVGIAHQRLEISPSTPNDIFPDLRIFSNRFIVTFRYTSLFIRQGRSIKMQVLHTPSK